ncbi:MAG TPA: hypothetical protein VGZ32_10395 [Actinocrinis sp.]|uniref:Imm32 family immunity protein n=1 Tax=Actinocrinis sp. TaxID=1920516 RepID=UPI002DDCEFBB|nr:hypothetical protein [Actinocrinis sp.]HEV3170740.1 hypothetical protein [Actinocrinis sp.]
MTQLEIGYAPPTHEAKIDMDRAAGRELADMIARGEGEMAGDQTADPAPYPQLLDAVRVATAPGKVVLGLDADGRVLTFTGALEHLAVLASNVRNLANDPDLKPITHLHVDYYEDHYYLAESEISLVFQVIL